MKLSIPGKTFLVGEYAVLAQGPCLSVGTQPFFNWVETQKTSSGLLLTAQTGDKPHQESAAGKLLSKFKQYEQFCGFISNPYQVGGFGASTAEFISAYYFLHERVTDELALTAESFFKTYLELYKDEQTKAQAPSGADLITQLFGGYLFFQKTIQGLAIKPQKWSLPQLEFSLFSTGLKIQTHEHLNSLNRQICYELIEPSAEVIQCFLGTDSALALEALNDWCLRLKSYDLTSTKVLELQAVLHKTLQQKISNVFVKPCGALGADVVAIFYPSEHKQLVLNTIKNLQLNNLVLKTDLHSLGAGPLASSI